MNVVEYAKKYGDISFKEKEFNEIDNLVLASLAYIDFDKKYIFINNTIEYVGKKYLAKEIKIKNLILAKKDAYELLKVVVNNKRYKNIRIRNYVYKADYDMQFKAITFKIPNSIIYVAFEGTDELISGWKEDFNLAYKFPTPSQTLAIKYLNNTIKILGPNVIVGGHSKGGNLALVSSMYVKNYKKSKIIHIYNNDGPGLLENEFKSMEYESILPVYTHIIPHSSNVGILLNSSNYKVIKSSKNNIVSHSVNTWQMDETGFILEELSKRSVRLKKDMNSWVTSHDKEDIKNLIEDLFSIMDDIGITKINNIKISNIISTIRKLKYVDKTTKDLLKELLLYNYIGIKRKK